MVIPSAEPARLITVSEGYAPVRLTGVKFYPDQPFKLDFIIDRGDSALAPEALKAETARLVRYFLTALTIPEDDLWVNLAPGEKSRVAPQALSQTELGRDLLNEDYLLKQLASSLTYPDSESGKAYWRNAVGDNLQRVWIVPKHVHIYEGHDMAVIGEASLKALAEDNKDQALKDNILPLIEQDVNTGKNFALLRQVCSAIILAAWFKHKLRARENTVFNKGFFDKKKISGIESNDPKVRERIYGKYLEALQKGAYDYVKTDRVRANGRSPVQKITRSRYFSGGVDAKAFFTGEITTIERLVDTTALTNVPVVVAGVNFDSLDLPVAGDKDVIDESSWHPYPRWLKVDQDSKATSGCILPVIPSMYRGGLREAIDEAADIEARVILLAPPFERSYWDERQSNEHPREEYARGADAYIEAYLKGEPYDFPFFHDTSLYAPVSYYIFDIHDCDLSRVDGKGATIIEKYYYWKRYRKKGFNALVNTMREEPFRGKDIVEGAEVLALRILRTARPDYLPFILKRLPGYRLRDIVGRGDGQIIDDPVLGPLYQELVDLILFGQYWMYKQMDENITYAETKTVKILVDIPACLSIVGVEAARHSGRLCKNPDGTIQSPGRVNLDESGNVKGRQDWRPLAKRWDWQPTRDALWFLLHRFHFAGTRQDAWPESLSFGNWDPAAKVHREQGALGLVENLGDPRITDDNLEERSRVLGMLSLVFQWGQGVNERGSVPNVNVLAYGKVGNGEYGLARANDFTVAFLPASHDGPNVAGKYFNLFDGFQGPQEEKDLAIVKGIHSIVAMASNIYCVGFGATHGDSREINPWPGRETIWDTGYRATGHDLRPFFRRLNHIRRAYPFILNPKNISMKIIAHYGNGGVVQVERYSKDGKRAIVSIHNISGHTATGTFWVDYSHFGIDFMKPSFALRDLSRAGSPEYVFRHDDGTLVDNCMFYRLAPGECHIFYLGLDVDYTPKTPEPVMSGAAQSVQPDALGGIGLKYDKENMEVTYGLSRNVVAAHELTNFSTDFAGLKPYVTAIGNVTSMKAALSALGQ